MDRAGKLKLNSIFLIIYQIISVVTGLIVPKLILTHYGSEVNGLTYSIIQMLAVINYFDFGISAVAQAALYAPIENVNIEKVSVIYAAVKKYFNRLTFGLIFYTICLCFYYGFTYSTQFTWSYCVSLVLVTAFSLTGQYIFGISNQVLLAADQKIYIYTLVNIFSLIINTLLSYVLIVSGKSIQIVKLVSAVIFFGKPVLLQIYVNSKYNIKKVEIIPKDALPNKWSGLVQHLATTLTSSLDTIVLTFFSTLSNISIYNVYTFPLNGIRTLVESLSGSFKSYFGHVLLSDGKASVDEKFVLFEGLMHGIAVVFLLVSFKMLIPFVLIYTYGVSDINYENKYFAYVILFAYIVMIIKIPYTTIIFSAGHFKQTQKYCLIEVVLNVLISVAMVFRFGLIGVAIGTCVSVGYRAFASIFYLHKNILNYRYSSFLKIFCVDFITVIIFMNMDRYIPFSCASYFSLILWACLYSILSIMIFAAVYSVFYNKYIKKYIRREQKSEYN